MRCYRWSGAFQTLVMHMLLCCCCGLHAAPLPGPAAAAADVAFMLHLFQLLL
jgi:hypothetical protein